MHADITARHKDIYSLGHLDSSVHKRYKATVSFRL